MNNFNLHFALVETVEAGDKLFNIEVAVDTVDDLLSERIFLVFVNHKVCGEPFVEEGVEIFEDNFDAVFGFFFEEFAWDKYVVLLIYYFFGL